MSADQCKAAIARLLAAAKAERDEHRAAALFQRGRQIDAAASSIRVQALEDALKAVAESASAKTEG